MQQMDEDEGLSGSDSDGGYDENTNVMTQVMSQSEPMGPLHRSILQRQASGRTHQNDDTLEVMEHVMLARIARANSFAITVSDLGAWQHPNSKFRRNWNICLFLGVCYHLIVIPVRIAFLDGIIAFPLYAVDLCLDVAFLLDVVFRARYFAVFSFGKLLKTREGISDMYRKSGSLLTDVATCAPIDVFALIALGIAGEPSAIWVLALLRIPKLLHARRLFRLTHVRSLMGLFVLVAIIANICGCGFYLIARAYATANREDRGAFQSCISARSAGGNATINTTTQPLSDMLFKSNLTLREVEASCMWEGTWVTLQMTDNLMSLDGSTATVRWLRSFNWAMPTLLVVVIGDATPVNFGETLYVSFIILFGLIVNAMVLGVMADRLTDTNSQRSRHRLNMDMVERWLILSGVADHVLLCDRIRDHMRYTFALTEGLDEAKVFSEMPQQLRHEAAKYLRVPQLDSSVVFRNCSAAFLQALSEALLVRHYSGGDIICIKGEYMSEMFFVQRGLAELSAGADGANTSSASETDDDEEKKEEKEEEESHASSSKSTARGGGDSRKYGMTHKGLPTLSSGTEANDATRLRTVQVGESFGGAAMVGHRPSPVYAHALEHLMVLVLQRSSFKEIIRQFPDQYDMIPEIDHLVRSDSSPGNGGLDSDEEAAGERKQEPASQDSESHDSSSAKFADSETDLTDYVFVTHTSAAYHAKWNSWEGKWQLHSLFRDLWDSLSLINILYFAIMIPLRIAVLVEDRVSTGELIAWYVFDYIIDMFFLADMVLRARRFHSVQDDRVIDLPSEIWKKYRSWAGTDPHVVDDDEVLTHNAKGHARYVSASDSMKHRKTMSKSGMRGGEGGAGSLEETAFERMHDLYIDCITFIYSDFFFDILASLPLDLIALAGGPGLGGGITWLKWLRLNRLVRSMRHANELFESVDRFVHQRFHIWSGFYSLMVKVWTLFWLVNHVSACMWIIIHRYMERDQATTWATVDGVATFNVTSGEHNIFHERSYAYLRAFYFVTVVISTCGYGDIRPYTSLETVFAQLVTLSGALGLASMVGTFLFYFQ